MERQSFTTGQVAELVGCSQALVKKWFTAGVLGGYVLPGSRVRRIRRADLLAFLEGIGFIPGPALTSGQAAMIAGVSPRTIKVWFDDGWLEGYRLPGSKDRRILRESLLKFMELKGIPVHAELEPVE